MPRFTTDTAARECDIVICGNGASAVALLCALGRNARAPLRVIVIGSGNLLGEGLAYATKSPSHLLNTPAGRMSLDPDRPQQFEQWLEAKGIQIADWGDAFVPRSQYALYLRAMLARAVCDYPHLDLGIIRADVTSLVKAGDDWLVSHGEGMLLSHAVVLAVGNDMPTPIAAQFDPEIRSAVIDNPWTNINVGADERVLILGTGLTAVDTVLSLADRGHRGEITLVSRHALLPHTHVASHVQPPLRAPYPATARGLVRALRQAVGSRPSPEIWQGFMDAMRPHWASVWAALPATEQRRGLRHGATIWNMHRHRLAPKVGERFGGLLKGNVKVVAGRLSGAVRSSDQKVTVTLAHCGKSQVLAVDRIINCMGPNSDPEKSQNQFIENIIASRLARSSPSGIGLDVDDRNRVLDRAGSLQFSLFAIGALTRGHWWESTAMPEIARQAGAIAADLLMLVAERAYSPAYSI